MKNKKKTNIQSTLKYEGKLDKKQSTNVVRKSPIKSKHIVPKSQLISTLDYSNLNFCQNKQSNIFYGKKYRQIEVNPKKGADSNQSSTHCSINNRSHKEKSFQTKKTIKHKSTKNIKNHPYCHEQVQEQDDLEVNLSSNQVMQLINSYAIKIQRQWRRYWFRKCLMFIILKKREEKQFMLQGSRNSKIYFSSSMRPYAQKSQQPNSCYNPQQDQTFKRHTLPKLSNKKSPTKNQQNIKQSASQSQNIPSESFFNNIKYSSLNSFGSNNIKKTQNNHERTSSLGQKVEQQNQSSSQSSVHKVEMGVNCSIQMSQKSKTFLGTPVNNLISDEQNTAGKKSSEKKSNIKLETKVIQVKLLDQGNRKQKQIESIKSIGSSKHKDNDSIINLVDEFRKQNQSPRDQPKPKSLKNSKKYDTKFPLDTNTQKDMMGMTTIFKKCKKALKKQTQKKIQKISRNYEQKQITQRTYKHLVNQTKQKMTKEMKSLQIKEGDFKNSWNEVYVMFKDYVKENSFVIDSERNGYQLQSNRSEKNQLAEDELSFDRWDFDSSAKKSISHLQSFEDFARQLNQRNPQKFKGFCIENKKINDQRPIQIVLQELDRLQSGLGNWNKNQIIGVRQKQQGSIFDEFKNRQRSQSWQKKSEHILIEASSQKKQAISPNSPFHQSIAFAKQPQHQNYTKSPRLTSINEIQIQKNQKFISPSKSQFQFINLKSPQNSLQDLPQASKENVFVEIQQIDQKVKTDESQEQDSEVQIKITSINVGKENSSLQTLPQAVPLPEPMTVEQPQKSFAEVQLEEIQRTKKQREKLKQAEQFIIRIASQYQQFKLLPPVLRLASQAILALKQGYKQKQRRKQLQLIQLKKYPVTIDPSIDSINSWLLQISHHLLDHHNSEIKRNLLTPKQLPSQQLLQICHNDQSAKNFHQSHFYSTVSEKIFKEFEFFYLKNCASNLEIQERHQQNFQQLLYAFHRCLVDCLNVTLLDELSISRNWVMLPWNNAFRYKRKQVPQHTKACLEKAINRVSGWAEYSLAQLTQTSQINPIEWKQYQQQKMNLVIREQVLEFSFDNEFVVSNLILKMCSKIYETQIILAVKQMSSIFKK